VINLFFIAKFAVFAKLFRFANYCTIFANS
jgi:hypothetical protein